MRFISPSCLVAGFLGTLIRSVLAVPGVVQGINVPPHTIVGQDFVAHVLFQHGPANSQTSEIIWAISNGGTTSGIQLGDIVGRTYFQDGGSFQHSREVLLKVPYGVPTGASQLVAAVFYTDGYDYPPVVHFGQVYDNTTLTT
ncbi:hypothetical protein M231_04378 [Tremella mesenterica]|uniref:Uncharacterized protein n=2 Tax=Tremella mesenterica TaxID=5217 RepID=A0A4Q1BKV3_TREME|nr:hypothetical protein M231_04378 [Tremella mesenterica]